MKRFLFALCFLFALVPFQANADITLSDTTPDISTPPPMDFPPTDGPIVQYPSTCIDSGELADAYYGNVMNGILESGAGYKMLTGWTYDETTNTMIRSDPQLPYREVWLKEGFDIAREMAAIACGQTIK